MQKILIIAPSWVGDMVMAEPLLRLLQHSHHAPIDSFSTTVGKFFIALVTGTALQPTATSEPFPTAANHPVIDIVAPSYLAPLLQRIPHINRVWTTSFAHGKLNLKERWRLAKELRAQNYIQAIILPNSLKSALLPWWAGIPLRTGWRGEMRYLLLNDLRLLNQQQLPLMVQRFAALGLNRAESDAAHLPPTTLVPQLFTTPELVNATLRKLELPVLKPMSQPILALCIGAEYGEAKRWPAAYFAAVARQKFQEGWEIWLLGSSKDAAIATAVQQESDGICHDLTGKTTLAEVVDLLSLAKAVVTNDSGLMHIAAALNIPVIAIYGSSSPAFTPPLAHSATRVRILSLSLPCSPCFKRRCPLGHFKCMLELKPHLVIEALSDVL